jgi:hypothetical protein
MIYLLAVLTSLGLVSLGSGVIWLTVRHKGQDILLALAGEVRFQPVVPQPRIRRTARLNRPMTRPVELRAAA